MRLRFVQVDAFAVRAFAGNPAAVMPLDSWLDDATLQGIAAENNLSETAFLVPAAGGDVDYDLRWFTPTVEVAMCGHATLAAGHVVLGDDPALDRVRFSTRKAGVLEVRRAGDALELDLPVVPMKPGMHDALLDALGVPGAMIYLSDNAAEDSAIVLIEDERAVRAIAPDMAALARIAVMAIVTAPGDTADIASRVFVPAWGIDEDPVTGSAHAALAPFWAERLGRARFSAVQASARGGVIDCRVAGNRVVLGGRCVTVIEGAFLL